MKQHTRLFLLITVVLCLFAFAACGEGMTVASFFPEASYYHVVFDRIDSTQEMDAVFYEDGSIHGVTDALEETYGYYAILPDNSLLLDIGSASFQLDANENGAYSGSRPDSHAACFMTPIARSAFDTAAEQADLYIDSELDRVDIPLWDYPVYARITLPDGLDLLVNPSWSELAAVHLPSDTLVRILGVYYDNGLPENGNALHEYDESRMMHDIYLLEADGFRGFALDEGIEWLPVCRAEVVRATPKEKGRTVNIRSTPDYGDNIIQEVPYGEIVDVFPVVEGEFTRVYYDYGEGWMTTVRLRMIDE